MSGILRPKNVFAFALFVGFYFLLAQSFDLAEISVCLASSLLATIALDAVAARSPIRYAVPARWTMMRAASPLRVLKGAAAVLALIPRAAMSSNPIGRFGELPIAIKNEGPTDAARLGLATWAVSLAPDTYVVRFDGDALVVHHASAEGKSGASDA